MNDDIAVVENFDASQVEDLIHHGEMRNPPTPSADKVISGNQSGAGVKKSPVVSEDAFIA